MKSLWLVKLTPQKCFPDLPLITTITASRSIKCLNLEDTVDRLLPPCTTNNKNSLKLPSIVIQCESPSCEKHLSPMSSRSESPLSDRTTGMGKFSPQFYGKNKDILPFTDSDGLYDFPSSDKVNVTSCTHHKKVGSTPRKLSPKRRIARSQVVSSSSSSDSITSRENRPSSSSPSPDTIRWSSPLVWMSDKYLTKVSREESCEEAQGRSTENLSKSPDFSKDNYSSHKKFGRLRSISHQIRFLRRLEHSLKRTNRAVSLSDSFDSGEESPRATSPLLQPSSGPKNRNS
ncbi:hypothetical protein NQ317_004458 [Molorchus minor]|uniref:Uncharacterized protein n=1 Tax=Molorchus minor TaxID=1323400 RepID=A0ABQ9JN59_9CUCU|nr:hypothetical protein NQ317_004458 [Molorchus minor]